MSYSCAKCAGTEFSTSTVSTTGGAFSRMIDFAAHEFTAVSCDHCGYTELFRSHSTGLANLLDGLGAV
jgi:uncharacterized protein